MKTILFFLLLSSAFANVIKKGPFELHTNYYDLNDFPATSYEYSKMMDVYIHIISSSHRFWGAKPADRELVYQIETMKEAFRQCGIETNIRAINLLVSGEYDDIDRNSQNSQFLGDDERTIFKHTMIPNKINVYIIPGVNNPHSQTSSYAWTDNFMMYEKTEDRNYLGTTIISHADLMNNNASTQNYLMAHEVGHLVMNTSHVFEYGKLNLMNNYAEYMGVHLHKSQCQKALSSRFVSSTRK